MKYNKKQHLLISCFSESILVDNLCYKLLKPNYSLDFVMRIKLKDFVRTGKTDTIKASTQGLFLKKEYICISILKIGDIED